MKSRFNLFTDDLPWRAKVLIGTSIALGLPCVVYSLYKTMEADPKWLLLAGLTLLGSLLPVRLPFLKDRSHTLVVSTGDLIVIAAMLLFSPEVAVTIAALDCLACGSRTRKPYRILFNLSQLSFVTFFVGHLLYWLLGTEPPIRSIDPGSSPLFFVELFACAFLYFILNTGAIALAVSLVTRTSVIQVWRQNFLWASVTSLAGTLAAMGIFFLSRETTFMMVVIAGPFMLLLAYAYRMNRKRLDTLRDAKLFLQSTLDSLESYISIVDEDGTIVAVNRGWETLEHGSRFFGSQFSPGTNYIARCEEDHGAEAQTGVQIASGVRNVLNQECRTHRLEYSSQGRTRRRWMTLFVSRFEHLGRLHAVVAHEDITELKEAEEALRTSEQQLRQAQKMEAIGRLAGGVAHDFNNMLTAIMGYTDLILYKLPEADPIRPNLDEIRKAADRSASLTRQLLAFSRKQILQPKRVELKSLVDGTEKMLRPMIGEDVHLTLSEDDGPFYAKVDPGQMEQVLMNLVINARDAMPEGGSIGIDIFKADLTAGNAPWLNGCDPGRFIGLSVVDNGGGMDEETRSRIFEPFFTTKDPGHGTGLGLSTVYGIVQQSEGCIRVESEPGAGTTFTVFLPRDLTEPARDRSRKEDRRHSGGCETVLLVEDEDVVRLLTSRILEDRGYRVLDAAHPDDALRISGLHSDSIELLITDVVMPRLNGLELADRLRSTRPDMKVLFISGYAKDSRIRVSLDDSGRAFLPKPFSPEAMAGKVREILDGVAHRNGGSHD